MNKLSENENVDEVLPKVPGCEFAGEVLAIGDYAVDSIKVGDKVVALLGN